MMTSLLIGLTRMKNSPAGQPAQVQAKAVPKAFKGILLAASGLLFFACMDTTTKYLTAHFNVPFVVAMRYLVHCTLMLVILAPRHSGKLIKTQRTGLVIVRAATLTIASLFVGLALQRMPLAETTAINFLAPTLVALFATFILGEEIGGLGWIAVVAGFIGVLLIARPSSGLDFSGVVFALLAACAGAAYQLLSRVLSSTEKAVTMLFYTALVGSIVFGIALPWFWENKVPSNLELALFFSMGLAGGLGHFLFTLAFRYAPASVLAPVTYLQLLWAGLLGWLIFDTTPDGLSILGMVIIAGAGLLIALKSRFGKPASTKTD
jgi:drug/metabolite transporter (DMT)-like permease